MQVRILMIIMYEKGCKNTMKKDVTGKNTDDYNV